MKFQRLSNVSSSWMAVLALCLVAAAGCGVDNPDTGSEAASVTASGCFHTSSGAIVCTGVGQCATHTGQSFWGTEILSNGPQNDTGNACCPMGATCNGVVAKTGRSFECTDLVMRHFAALGPDYDISKRIYTGTMCGDNFYGGNSHFDVYHAGSVPPPQPGDVIVFHGHTVVISEYDSSSSKVWFYQQNAIWTDKSELLVKDHTTYGNQTIAGKYGLSFNCLIRAKNVCQNVGDESTSGCLGGATKTCQPDHQWSTCSAPTHYAKHWWTGTLQNGGLCAEASGTSGSPIAMAGCSTTNTRQNWFMTSSRYLESFHSSTCAAPEASQAGAAVRQGACSGSDPVWHFHQMEVVSGQTGDCMDVPAADYHVGQNLIQWPCHGGVNQQITYKPATGELVTGGYCVDAGTADKGAPVTLQACDGSRSQRWNDAHGGFTSAVATATPRCLALDGGASATAGAHLVVAGCDDSVDQMWALRGDIASFDASYCLRNAGSALEIAPCDVTQADQEMTFWMNF